MIITCPSCETKFRLDPALLTDEGHYVRCSECSEVWHQKHEEPENPEDETLQESATEGQSDADIPESVKPDPDDHEEEPGSEKKPLDLKNLVYGHIAASVIFILFMAGFLSMQSSISQSWLASVPFYEALGYDVSLPGEALVFDRLTLEPQEDVIVVSGNLINLSSQSVSLPLIMTVILDEEGNEVSSHYDEFELSIIEAEESINFSVKHPYEPQILETVENMDIRLVWNKSE